MNSLKKNYKNIYLNNEITKTILILTKILYKNIIVKKIVVVSIYY